MSLEGTVEELVWQGVLFVLMVMVVAVVVVSCLGGFTRECMGILVRSIRMCYCYC